MSSLLKLLVIALLVGWFQLPVMHERSLALSWGGAEAPVQEALGLLKESVGPLPMAARGAAESAKISMQAAVLAVWAADSAGGAALARTASASAEVSAAATAVRQGARDEAASRANKVQSPLGAHPAKRREERIWTTSIATSEEAEPVKTQEEGAAKAKAGGTVLLVGDSVMGEIAYGMKRWSAKNKAWSVIDAHKVSSGLANLDYYDWPTVFEELLDKHKPTVVAMMVGSNDAQDIFANHKRQPFGSPGWVGLYDERVQAILRCAEKHGVQVYWAVPPVMKSASFEKRMKVVRATLKAALGAHPSSAVLLDEWQHFAGEKDEYLETGTVGGKVRSLRTEDGIHLSVAGAQIFVDALIEALTPTPWVAAGPEQEPPTVSVSRGLQAKPVGQSATNP